MSSQVFHLFSHTILHCGTGQSVGVVDQPIARDRASYLPIVPGSTVRGVLRAELSKYPSESDVVNTLFGHTKNGEDSGAGALSISDAHLLLLPIRSVYGILAYATCPFILKRYKRDLKVGMSVPEGDKTSAFYVGGSPNIDSQSQKLYLEDLDLDVIECDNTKQWARHIAGSVYDETAKPEDYQDMMKRIIILPDTVFSFLAETATEIRTRIRIDPKTGVVATGALWSEESLPAESLLWGVLNADKTPKTANALKTLDTKLSQKPLLQMGGNTGVGSGLVQFSVLQGE